MKGLPARRLRKSRTLNNSETLTSSTKLSRLEFLKLGGAGLAGVTLLGAAGCGGEGGGGGGSAGEGLVFTSYGGSFQKAQTKAWLTPYSKEIKRPAPKFARTHPPTTKRFNPW
jgi:hypothetical protein